MNHEIRIQIQKGSFALSADLSIPTTGVTALFGPSGCGKTTLLRSIAGLEKTAAGKIIINGQIWQDETAFTPPHKRTVGYVFQEASLFDHLNVSKNLQYGLSRLGMTKAKISYEQVVEFFQIAPLLDRQTHQLSGGERQRIALGRAVLTNPEILLLDEPLSALDKPGKNEIVPFLEKLRDELRIPMIYVSHDLGEVQRLANHMVFLKNGKVAANGKLHQLLTDPNLPFSEMPDAASVFDARFISYDHEYGLGCYDIDGTQFLVAGKQQKSTITRLVISASDVAIARADKGALIDSSILNKPQASIIDVQPFGDYQFSLLLSLGQTVTGPKLIARITRKSWERLNLQKGDQVFALIKSVAIAS